MAVLLQPQDVKWLVESTEKESEIVDLAVILHLDCKVFIRGSGASERYVPIDVRLDATAPRVLRGKSQVFSIAGYWTKFERRLGHSSRSIGRSKR